MERTSLPEWQFWLTLVVLLIAPTVAVLVDYLVRRWLRKERS